jgi:quercetin dioxygenase-like cupin family protein
MKVRLVKGAAPVIASSLVLLAALAQPPTYSQATQLQGTRRVDLQRRDLDIPGFEAVQARVEIDPGVTSQKHTHPGDEIVYVLEGSLEYAVDGSPPVTLRAGDVLFIPAGAAHTAKNVGSTNGVELATYVVEIGKPLVVVVK